jgi:hypothetical protein
MGRSNGVPGGAPNGSFGHGRVLGPLEAFGAAVVLLGAAAGGCLAGNAQPIVRVENDASAASEAGAPASSCPAGAPLELYYRTAQASPVANSIDFLVKVENGTGFPLPLSALAVRYYFTNEITPTWQTAVYYAGECCNASRSGFTADVAVTVNAMPATPTADHYLEVTFDPAAGTLLAGDSVQVEIAFFAPGHGQNVNQANDYSFIASAAGTQAEWDQCPAQCAQFGSCVMTVYENGALVWGTPP